MRRSASLSQEDKRVIQLFTYREKGQSKNMNSTGDRLDGFGAELKGIAFWEDDKIWFVEKGSRTGQQIHKMIKKLIAYPNALGGYKDEAPMLVMRRSASEIIRNLESRIDRLEKSASSLAKQKKSDFKVSPSTIKDIAIEITGLGASKEEAMDMVTELYVEYIWSDLYGNVNYFCEIHGGDYYAIVVENKGNQKVYLIHNRAKALNLFKSLIKFS